MRFKEARWQDLLRSRTRSDERRVKLVWDPGKGFAAGVDLAEQMPLTRSVAGFIASRNQPGRQWTLTRNACGVGTALR